MPCRELRIGNGVGFICGRSARAKVCSVCGGRGGTLLCDGPHPKTEGATCDRVLCPGCALHPPGRPLFGSVVRDLCPTCFEAKYGGPPCPATG